MEPINVVILADLPDLMLAKITAINPCIQVTDARHKFDEEIRQSWPPATVERYLYPSNQSEDSKPRESSLIQARRERDALLGQANIACIGFPYPLDLISRAPCLKWIHHTSAAASNLRFGDIYQNRKVIVTTSRGHNKVVPIAEYVIASMLSFAKDIALAVTDKQKRQLERQNYHPILMQGKTVGIVGLGGIGREVARLAKAFGMRVLAIRRSILIRTNCIDDVDILFPPQDLNFMLSQCDFVAICAQHTPETERMIGEAQLRAMKPTAFLVNIARGELIDEDILVKALREKWIRGAVLDVYAGEFETPLRADFNEIPNLILTPHISGRTDIPDTGTYELFYENLIRFLDGTQLINVVDWKRGY